MENSPRTSENPPEHLAIPVPAPVKSITSGSVRERTSSISSGGTTRSNKALKIPLDEPADHSSKLYQVYHIHGPVGSSRCPACNQELPHPWHLPHLHQVESRALYHTATDPTLRVDSPSQTFWASKQNLKSRTGAQSNITSAVSLTTGGATLGLLNMAEEIPMFPKATSMFIHSGNIVNWNRLKRKPNQNSTDEVCECIGQTLGSYLESADKTQLQYLTQLYKVNTENIQVLGEGEREEVKITVKVFVCALQPNTVIQETVGKVLNELGTNYVETLLLAVSPVTGEEEESDQSQVSLSTIKPYWEAMEELVAAGKVLTLGVCDLNKDSFEDLYNWAKVKPCIDQVNLESCCVMPKELTEFAKSVNVQLLTHNDRPVFITKERLQETIQAIATEGDSDAWTPQWAVRYSGIMKCRGIIKMKGYIFHAIRDNKKRLL